MLYLLKQEQGDGLFYFFEDKEYVIGRKNAHIELKNDLSISRKHAIINTRGNTITLTDCGAKYGTFHNKIAMKPNFDVTLDNNDLVKFGIYDNKYRLKKIQIVTVSSSLTTEEKIELKTNLNSLGATVVNHWNNTCTHLTTNEVVLTVKVLHALVDKKPIVTPQYWTQFLANTKDGKMPPDTEDFKPPFTENLVNAESVPESVDRTQVFAGKIFVFASEKRKKSMADLIKKTAGCSISWERQQVSLTEVIRSKNYLFVYEDSNSCSQEIPKDLQDMWKQIEKLGERTIPIQEIAMAVVQNSCEKDCNPKFNRIYNVFNVIAPETETTAVSLAQNTPEEDFDLRLNKKELVIPESLEADAFDMPPPRVPQITKRKLPLANNLDKNLPSTSKVDASKNTIISSSINNSIVVPQAIPSTSRQADESPIDNPPKRLRLEDSTEQSQEDSVQNKPTGSGPMLIESKKRKAEEEPIAFVRKRHEIPNPFACLKRRKGSSTISVKEEEEEDNPFLEIVKRRSEVNTVKRRDETIEEVPLKFESLDHTPSDVSDIVWISTKYIKSQLEVVCKLEPNVEPELQEMFEKFKDTIVIETMPAPFARAVTPLCATMSDSGIEVKNFKKFRKVQPRHPQSTILATSFQGSWRQQEIPLQPEVKEVIKENLPEIPILRRSTEKKTATFVF